MYSYDSIAEMNIQQAEFARLMMEEEEQAIVGVQNEAVKKAVIVVKKPRIVKQVRRVIYKIKRPVEEPIKEEVKKTPIIKNLDFGKARNFEDYILREGDEIVGSLDGTTSIARKQTRADRFEYLEDAMEDFWKELDESGLVEKADAVVAAWAKENNIPDNPEFDDAAREDYIREREAFRIFKQHMWEKHHT